MAFEISNEPHHGGTVDEVKAYINKMVAFDAQNRMYEAYFLQHEP
jgi:hypothetical protein